MSEKNKKISKILSLFRDPKTDKLVVVSDMFCQLSYNELHEIQKKIPRLFSGLTKVNYLKRQSFSKVASSGCVFGKGNDVCEYIGTLAYIFEQHRDSLNLFVKLLGEFEINFLFGDYDTCKKIIDNINTQISYSYWGADLEIKLDRLFRGLSKATETHNELFNANDKLAYLCNLSFKTSTIDVPFDSEVTHFLKKMKDQYSRECFISHCFPYIDNYEGAWMYADSVFSIIDLYCGFIYSLDNLSKETTKNEKFIKYLTIISNVINDIRLKKRVCLLKNQVDDSIRNDERRQKILVDYLRQDYSSVIEDGEKLIQDRPYDISILDLYVKSCIIKQKRIRDISDGSIAQKIQYYYYCYLLNNENSDVFRKKLLNICEVWYSIPSLKHMYWLIYDRSSNDITLYGKNYWRCSCGWNIHDAFFYDSSDERKKYILSLSGEFASKVPSWQQNNFIADKTDFVDFQLFEKNTTDGLLYELDKLVEEKNIPPFSKNVICSYVCNRYLALSKITEAIGLYAREKTSEKYLNITLDEELTNRFLDSDIDKQSSNPLDFAIFYTCVNAAPYKRYLSLKRFLKQCGVNKVSELTIDGSKKLQFFLESVADRQVLSFMPLFKNSNEVIDERIAICKNLYDYYLTKKYLEEISSLSKEQTISGLIQRVNDSKIYVDTENIRNKELRGKDFNVLFNVYKNTDDKVNIFENKSRDIYELLSLLQTNGIQCQVYSTDKKIEEINYKASLFKKLFLDVRDKFVFDPKYGLDYYLSTRIRHGTIDNQLRNHLQECHLVTNTDDTGKYIPNTYWLSRLGHSEVCNNIFNQFSKNIDDLVFALKSERIQIKTEDEDKKSKAVFDFSADKLSSYINSLYLKCAQMDFDDCVSLIFDELWEYTEICMSQMKNDVLEETHNLMRKSLNQLYADISSAQNHSPYLKEFKDAITSCQTSLQSDFKNVQQWFQRKDISTFDFSIQQVLDASLFAINRINQERLEIKKEISSLSSFKGEYFGAMHDLFHDILNNVLDYEKKRKTIAGNAVVTIQERCSMLIIEVTNPIAEQDVSDLKNLIGESEGGYASQISTGRSRLEGKSGFAKIYNIVTNVFESPDNEYNNSIEENMFKVKICINISKLIRL